MIKLIVMYSEERGCGPAEIYEWDEPALWNMVEELREWEEAEGHPPSVLDIEIRSNRGGDVRRDLIRLEHSRARRGAGDFRSETPR